MRETFQGAFPQHVPLEKRLVASLYTVYLDESGTHAGSEHAVVAGFVSDVTQWGLFADKWHAALSGVVFHMSDFENRRGNFGELTNDERKALLNNLLTIIHDHTFFSIGAVVQRSSYEAVVSDLVKAITGDMYGMAALACWRHLGLWLKELDAWMDCSMEAGASGRRAIDLIFEEDRKIQDWQMKHRIISLSFRDKRLFSPLQAADILAYELFKQADRQFGNNKRPLRYPLTRLGQKRHQWVFLTENALRETNDDVTKQFNRLR